MAGFTKFDRISARIHPSEKEKLKKSGYNARQAIEYFNSLAGRKIDALKIEEHFLNKEIEEMREELILKERRLAKIQQIIDEVHIDRLSSLRVDSYQVIIDMFNTYKKTSSNTTFEQFVNGSYIHDKFISDEAGKFPECDVDTFCEDLIEYYNEVVLVGRTF